jgi:flavin reductase (DIM6/NTAB) family NADH-FMN oxidoreductase RutF
MTMSDVQMPQAAAETYEAIELSALTREQRYKMLTGAVIPRPIAFVSSIAPNGGINVAPFSQFVIIAVDPGLLGISIGPRPGGLKDTLVNIRRTGEFVINMVPEEWAQTVQVSSEAHPPDVSEVALLGLATVPSVHVLPPRLACCKIQFECKLAEVIEFGSAPNRFVVGEVVMMHVREGLTSNFKIDPRAYAPLARIGGRNYVRLGEIVSV